MYCPKHFEQHNIEAMHSLMRTFPLATLVMPTTQGIAVNHIPMHLSTASESSGLLSGHIPRTNSIWQEYAEGSTAIAVFHGPQAYITPSWYKSKRRHGKVVPTWNYTTVHAHGPVHVIHDRQWLMSHLEQLTDQLESSFEHPWAVSDAPREFTEKLVDHLVGVEMPIETLEGKWKVSQNRSEEDRIGVAEGLEGESDTDWALMSELVARRKD